MKKEDIKKKFKRFLAGGLMVCLMMPSFAGATWADVEDHAYTGVTKECLVEMNLEALQEEIEESIAHDRRFDSSVMKFESEDEDLVKQYETLFSTEKDGEPLYYVDYPFENGAIPAGTKVSVLVRKQKPGFAKNTEEMKPAGTESSEAAKAPEVIEASPAEAEEMGSAEMSTAGNSAAATESTIQESMKSTATKSSESSKTAAESTIQESMKNTATKNSESSKTAVESTIHETVEREATGSVEKLEKQLVSAQIDSLPLDTSESTQRDTNESTTGESTQQDTIESTPGGSIQLDTTESIAVESTENHQMPTAETSTIDHENTQQPDASSIEMSESTVPTETRKEGAANPAVPETGAVAKENYYNTATGSNAQETQTEDYKITGEEEIILFFQNKTLDDYIFQVHIGNRQTGKLYVPSASVLIEEAGMEKKRPEVPETTKAEQNAASGAGGSGNSPDKGGEEETLSAPDSANQGNTSQSNGSSSETKESQKENQGSIDHSGGQGAETNAPETDAPAVDDNRQEPEADAPATDDKNQKPEADVPAADNNHQKPNVDAPVADDNHQAPEANVPAADDNNQAAEANAPAADGNNEAPAAGLEVSISTHRVPRLTAPVAGEVNDEDFENRPNAGVDEEVSYSEDYTASTDPNEELGAALEPLLYKEKGRQLFYSLSASRNNTSGATITFLMSEVGQPLKSDAKGSLTIAKDVSTNGESIPENAEFIYEVTLSKINAPSILQDGEKKPVDGDTYETVITLAAGKRSVFSELPIGTEYMVTQTGVSDGSELDTQEITVTGGDGTIDYDAGSVTGTIQVADSLGKNEIVWNSSDNIWYDESGTAIDVEGLLGKEFLWYEDGMTGEGQITTAKLLQKMKEDKTEKKIVFNPAGGGIDIFYRETNVLNKKGHTWFSVTKYEFGRKDNLEKYDFNNKNKIEEFLGDKLIGWRKDPATGKDTTLDYYAKTWYVRPVTPLNVPDMTTGQSVVITYLGGYKAANVNLVLRKQLVTSDRDKTPRADDENQTFLYEIKNQDAASPHHGETFYATITVKQGETEGECTLSDIPASKEYEIRELENLRYEPVGETTQKINTWEMTSDIAFAGYKAYTGYFSDTNVIVNRVITDSEGGFHLATDYPDGQPVHTNVKLTPPPALVPEKTKSGQADSGEAEVPAA